MSGFGREAAAERSLQKSARELKALRKIIERYKDDPKGKKKMLKKMQKYWRSNLSIVEGMDAKPMDMKDITESFKVVNSSLDSPEYEDNRKEIDESEIRDMISKQSGDTNDQSGRDLSELPEGTEEISD